MDTHTIHFSLALLAAGFWVPAGIWLMLNRHALTVLASIPVQDDHPLPTVSIVIPARNEERNLEQALESVLALGLSGTLRSSWSMTGRPTVPEQFSKKWRSGTRASPW